jgi:hypothetical protein
MADQFINDSGPVFELTDEQIAQIRLSADDPSPSLSHDQVMSEMDRLLDRGE